LSVFRQFSAPLPASTSEKTFKRRIFEILPNKRWNGSNAETLVGEHQQGAKAAEVLAAAEEARTTGEELHGRVLLS
jgi:hypothetical protein